MKNLFYIILIPLLIVGCVYLSGKFVLNNEQLTKQNSDMEYGMKLKSELKKIDISKLETVSGTGFDMERFTYGIVQDIAEVNGNDTMVMESITNSGSEITLKLGKIKNPDTVMNMLIRNSSRKVYLKPTSVKTSNDNGTYETTVSGYAVYLGK